MLDNVLEDSFHRRFMDTSAGKEASCPNTRCMGDDCTVPNKVMCTLLNGHKTTGIVQYRASSKSIRPSWALSQSGRQPSFMSDLKRSTKFVLWLML